MMLSPLNVPTTSAKGRLYFYSHTRRSPEEEEQDQQYDIDRRVFSNLYGTKGKTEFKVPFIPIMKHTVLGKLEGFCVEVFFQAAKCQNEIDAKFIFTLENPKHVAFFGRGQLPLTASQMESFRGEVLAQEDLNTDLHLKRTGLQEEEVAQMDENGRKFVWVRKTVMRADWGEVKDECMFHFLTCKFDSRPELRKLSELSVHDLVETTKLDAYWGDGGDGSGFNVLGKLLSRLIRAQHNPSMQDFSSEGLHKPLKSS